MNKMKAQKFISVCLAILMLFTCLPVNMFATNNETGDDHSLEDINEENNIGTISNTETPSTTYTEIIPEDWELGLVFYDSTVDNGKTPLTEINWDASDEPNSHFATERTITVQINYKYLNATKAYQAGELIINIPSLDYPAEYLASTMTVGANSSYSNTDYVWDYSYSGDSTYVGAGQSRYPELIFTNAESFEEGANFEGSIQIQYKLKPYPRTEEDYTVNEYLYDFSKTLKATLNEQLESNEIIFNYQRTYSYNWIRQTYTLTKTAHSLASNDEILGPNPNDYIWVEYHFSYKGSPSGGSNLIIANNRYVYDVFPNDCVVYKIPQNQANEIELLTPDENNGYTINTYTSGTSHFASIKVGYPKETYKDQIVTNTADLYGTYVDRTEQELLATDDVVVNLQEFEFHYDEDIFAIEKSGISQGGPQYYQALIGEPAEGHGHLQYSISFHGRKMPQNIDMKIGDDLLYITAADGSYKKLEDDEYYIGKVESPYFYTDDPFSDMPYNYELWVRRANETEYSLYRTYIFNNDYNTANTTTTFTSEEKIVGIYFLVKNLKAGDFDAKIGVDININNTSDILENGTIYNFAYIEPSRNGITFASPDEDTYASLITSEEILSYDKTTYNHTLQRACAAIDYEYYERETISYIAKMEKIMSPPIISNELERYNFNTSISVKLTGGLTLDYLNTYYKDEELPESWAFTGYEIYDLLPKGMEFISNISEIKDKFYFSGSAYDFNKNPISSETLSELAKSNISIGFIKNWNRTGRTLFYAKIDLTDNPIIFENGASFGFENIPSFVSFDSYILYGNTYENISYGCYTGNTFIYGSYQINDSGYWDNQAKDINSNGITDEPINANKDSITISDVSSSHQDLKTFVYTDYSQDYVTGIAQSSEDTEYTYKLRVRTGANKITNLIIYDNLEMAYGNNDYWQGDFLSFDTSYAKSQGYTVKTYYSENDSAGKLYDENGELNSEWTLYSQKTSGLNINFNSQCRTQGVKVDYVEIYYIVDDVLYKLGPYGGTSLANKTIFVPSSDFYVYWHTNSTRSNYYGFSIDSIEPAIGNIPAKTEATLPEFDVTELTGTNYPDSAFDSYTHGAYGDDVDKLWQYTYEGDLLEYTPPQIKSVAFEYLNSSGTPATLSANSLTYVLINMKSPSGLIETYTHNKSWCEWNAIDDNGAVIDFVTGITSNIVRVGLPTTKITSLPSISLHFTKLIEGEDYLFENLKIDPNKQYDFKIKIIGEDGREIYGIINNNSTLTISELPIGTYTIKEVDDLYFDFANMTEKNTLNGVTLSKKDNGDYLLTINSSVIEDDINFEITITNIPESFRSYEDKKYKENLFLINNLEEIPR